MHEKVLRRDKEGTSAGGKQGRCMLKEGIIICPAEIKHCDVDMDQDSHSKRFPLLLAPPDS